MTVSGFLSDRLGRFLLAAFFGIWASVFLTLTGTAADIVFLLWLVGAPLFFSVQLYDFVRLRTRLKELTAIMDGLDRKYLFAECVPRAKNEYERRFLELFRRAERAMAGEVSDSQASLREYREYVESWVHEIKTPITAAELICRRAEPEVRGKLSCELAQIRAHVERALFYARAGSPEKDFLIRRVNLEELVAQAIDGHRSLMIQSKVGVETGNLEQNVYTDAKWASFILGQLLQNAVRYRRQGSGIRIWAERTGERVCLILYDNGMGIPSHELPRIFERGFTGSNGRSRGGSTGMGLYLCRKLSDCLELDITVTSKEGEWTKAVIAFPGGCGDVKEEWGGRRYTDNYEGKT